MVKLSDPLKIRNMEVKNRIGYPPMMSNCSNPDGSPSEGNIALYEQKAKGGTGILTYEAVNIDPAWVGGTQPNIGVKANIPKFKELTERVHKHGAKIGVQIQHPGALMFMGMFGTNHFPILLPSKVDPVLAYSGFRTLVPSLEEYFEKKPVQMIVATKDMIVKVQDQMAQASANAIQAGFDYVEIHSAHGTLYQNFVSPFFNHRTDEYGGTPEKRMTMIKETVGKMRKVMGEEPPIFVRISGETLMDDGIQLSDSLIIAKYLEQMGVDCIDVSMGVIVRSTYCITVPSYFDQGSFLHLSEAIKGAVNIPVMGVGRITDLRMADQFIQQGKADIINMGKQLICDPETVNKYLSDNFEDTKRCFGCGIACGMGICVYDPYTGPYYKALTPATKSKRIVILGGGIAGMEAARICQERGHLVDLFEKSGKLGGLMPIVAAEFKKEEYINISNWIENKLSDMEVSVHLNRNLTKEDIISLKPDVLAFAIGTKATVPVKFEGRTNVLTQDEAIMKTKPLGKNVVIWGLDTYWRGGVETAMTLIEQGYNVKAIIGKDKVMGRSIRGFNGRYLWIYEYFEKKDIPFYYSAKLEDVDENNITFIDEKGDKQKIEADSLVYCGSRISKRKILEKEFEGVAPEIVFLGDCKKPRDIREAMKDAHDFARNV
jgi:2,4-dienoyl-CoA reductase-like NADH-dependent reductase (Old Yellow Enzyme family)